jgi:formiminotetrahydrofolate cyclodeaminase
MTKDQSLLNFLDELAAKAPTPGGGGAAAIMGAMGAALLSMVSNLTLGKNNYESVQGDMQKLLLQSEELRARLTDMVHADARVYDGVMSAYQLPRETDEQKADRSQAIQTALMAATDVPLACAKASSDVMKLSRVAAELGNRNAVSDAGVAVLAAYAALRSAALNVYVNTGLIKDKEFVGSRLEELNSILAGADQLQEEIFEMVKMKL